MKKWIALLLAAALTMSALAGCGGDDKKDDGKGNETQAAAGEDGGGEKKEEGGQAEGSEDPIVFAYSGPLTGDNAEYGNLFKNAVELAVKQKNEEGGLLGRQIEVITFDDKNSNEEAGSIAEQIVGNDDVVAVFGHFASGVAMTAAPIYQETGIVLLSASASHVDYSSIGDYIFRNNVTQKMEATNCLQIAVGTGAKKIGVLKLKTDWGESAEKCFMEGWEKIKDKVDCELVATEEFVDGTTDYSSNITKFEEAGCDCIVVLGMYGSLGPFAKQYRQINKDGKLISVGSSYTTELINLAGEAAEGIQFPGGMNADSTDPKVKAYVDAYKEYADGKVPENMSAQTYENVQMVMQAIENVGSTDREAIKDELYNMTFEGITGTLSYDEVGDAVKTQVWYVVKDGKFVESDQKLQLWDDFEASLQ